MSSGEHVCDGGHRPRRFYRDRENGWLFGVCAGIADYFDVSAVVVRVIAVVGLFLFFWPTVLAYAAATLLFRAKPLTWYGRCHEYEFWRRHGRDQWRHS
ncbi:MAG TPA: PspC domain-containing protein [Woeseiaceae bacterium]|nr:PspC domain-containing protein [Woeseiaceae bacterium]